MARLKQVREDLDRERSYDPRRLSSPRIVLLSMLIFLAIVAFVAAILFRQISGFFVTNPGLNSLIVGVFLSGVLLTIVQVVRLFREVRWVNSFREGVPESEIPAEPIMLAPMKALIGRRQSMALSTTSMRSILDSIATRLDESRDMSRYIIGLLVFLGLLGTFWGLLQTIGSIGQTIQSLDASSGDAKDILDALKAGLQAPLHGMGTAFSSSLLGLSGSLIIGFLDLQAGRAQNRFYTELENWLSSVTDLGSDIVSIENVKAGSSEEMRILAERLKNMQDAGGQNQRTTTALANLAEGIQGLVKNMRNEQQLMRDWVEAQAEEQKAMRSAIEKLSSGRAIGRSE